MTRVYYYSWDDEDLVSIHIEVIKNSNESFTIELVQESFTTNYFYDIKANGTVTYKKSNDQETDIGVERIVIVQLKTLFNPKPETLFSLVKPNSNI